MTTSNIFPRVFSFGRPQSRCRCGLRAGVLAIFPFYTKMVIIDSRGRPMHRAVRGPACLGCQGGQYLPGVGGSGGVSPGLKSACGRIVGYRGRGSPGPRGLGGAPLGRAPARRPGHSRAGSGGPASSGGVGAPSQKKDWTHGGPRPAPAGSPRPRGTPIPSLARAAATAAAPVDTGSGPYPAIVAGASAPLSSARASCPGTSLGPAVPGPSGPWAQRSLGPGTPPGWQGRGPESY